MAVALSVVRTAIDRARLLSLIPVQLAIWNDCLTAEDLLLSTPTGLLTLKRKGAPPGASTRRVAFNGDGVYVLVRHPEDYKPTADRTEYLCEVECQGFVCSTSANGLTAAEGVRQAVEARLFPGVEMAEHWIPGKWDVCIDVAVRGEREGEASDWIEREIFADGHKDKALGAFVTRTSERKHTMSGIDVITDDDEESTREGRTIGTKRGGRSVYCGTSVQFIVYEKDRDPHRDVPLVKDRWREAGWDGESRVVRIEARVSRQWSHCNRIVLDSGTDLLLDKLAWSGFTPWIPTIARVLAARFRHTDRTDVATRKTRRRSSPLWLELERALAKWESEQKGSEWMGSAQLKAVIRETSLEKQFRAAEMALVRILQHAPIGTTLRAVAASIAGRIIHGESVHDRDALHHAATRYAYEMGLAPHGLNALDGSLEQRLGSERLTAMVPPDHEETP